MGSSHFFFTFQKELHFFPNTIMFPRLGGTSPAAARPGPHGGTEPLVHGCRERASNYEVEDKTLQSLRGIRRLEVAAERGLQSGHLRSKRPLDAPEEAPSATTSAPTALVVSPVPVAPTPIVTAFIKELDDEVFVVDGYGRVCDARLKKQRSSLAPLALGRKRALGAHALSLNTDMPFFGELPMSSDNGRDVFDRCITKTTFKTTFVACAAGAGAW